MLLVLWHVKKGMQYYTSLHIKNWVILGKHSQKLHLFLSGWIGWNWLLRNKDFLIIRLILKRSSYLRIKCYYNTLGHFCVLPSSYFFELSQASFLLLENLKHFKNSGDTPWLLSAVLWVTYYMSLLLLPTVSQKYWLDGLRSSLWPLASEGSLERDARNLKIPSFSVVGR